MNSNNLKSNFPDQKKKKIVFVLPSLRAGGAERVMSFLAVKMQEEGFETHLLVIGKEDKVSYDISNVPVTFFNKEKVRQSIFQLFKFMNKQKPDVILSSIAHLNLMMAFISIFYPKTKFIGREVIVITTKYRIKKGLNLKTFMHWFSHTFLDRVVCQSQDMMRDLHDNLGYPKRKLVVINNPVTKKFELKKSTGNGGIMRLITIGRLHQQKGYYRLLRNLAKLKIPFHYTIIGDGPERKKILDFVEELNIQERITHIPFTKNVEEYLSLSDLYVQGSFVEGFPNALLESCAVGTPVVAFDAPGGINEIIIPGRNGFIASDENDFLEKILLASDSDWNPEDIRKSVLERYSEEIILGKYRKLFEEVTS